LNVLFLAEAWEDYLHWLRADLGTVAKINGPIEEIRRQPFRGTGKPSRCAATSAAGGRGGSIASIVSSIA
jgi:Txe/YoeB family toxin of Txe-Axe toxin-antitoxin module